jgi:hypothetical protein
VKKSVLCSVIILLLFLCTNIKAQNCTVNAGIPQTICANGILTLQGQTSGSFSGGSPSITWSQVSGPLTTIINPASTTTSVTGFAAGSYTYQIGTTCLDGSTISDNVTITVRPIVVANAGADVTYCPGTYPMSANVASPGTGAWSIIGTNNGITIGTSNSATSNIVLNPSNAGNTTLRWTITQSTSGTTCTSADDVVITNRGGIATVNAGNDIVVNNCYTTTTSTALNASFAGANINGQQGVWSQVSGPNTATFSSANAATATASNLIQGTYIFRWTVSGPCVTGSDDVQVTVPAPTSGLTSISSITTQSFCDGRTSTVLTATQPAFAGETAAWTVVSGTGTFSNAANYNTTVSTMAAGSNTYRYTITNAAGCTAYKDAIVNNVSAPAVTLTTASPVLVGCGSSSTTINFTASGGTGNIQYRVISAPAGYTLPTSWSNTNTATSFTVTGITTAGTYLVRVMRSGTSDCNAATQDISVIVSQTPTASNAGTDQLLACNITSTALAGNIPSVGSGSWSQVDGPSTALIANASQYNTSISGLAPGAYNFKWIINAGNSCTPSEDIVTVRVANTAPTAANAGSDRTGICHTGPVQLDGNVPALNEVGTWTVTPSTGISFSNVNAPKAVVSGMAANTSYTFIWSIVNGCGSSSDDMIILTSGTQGAGQANAGADRCLSSATTSLTMAATAASPAGTVGTWTVISGPNSPTIVNVNSPTTTINGLTQGTYQFAWSLNVAGCGATLDTVVATISPTLTAPNAGLAQATCAANVTLAGNNPSIGTGAWTQVSGPGGATIVNPALFNTVVNGLNPGLYKFRWTISSGACSNYNDVPVTVSTLPSTASIAADSTCITRTVLASLAGNTPVSGIGTWNQISGPNVATITNMSLPTSGLSGLINGNYVFRWTIAGGTGCASSTADMNVSVNMPTSSISNNNMCNVTSATLTGNANIGGMWSQTSGPSTGTIQSVLPNIANVTNLQSGSYTFQFTPIAVAGCTTLTPRTITVNNSAPATPSSAGANQSLCNITSFSLAANSPLTGTGSWTRVSGPNTPGISSVSSNTPTLTSAVTGLYTYRWTITNGGCTSADDVTVLISPPASTATAGAGQTICSTGGIATLSGNVPAVGTGAWSQISGPLTASFNNTALNSPTVTGLTTPGSYAFKWTISNGACTNNNQTTVQVDEAPNAFAGNNATVFGNNYTLQATQPSAGIGTWSQVNGPTSVITDINAYNTTVTGLQISNSYTYRWTVTNGNMCPAAVSDVVINVSTSLPLTLTSFAGKTWNGQTDLQWHVTNEVNVSRFDVERSDVGMLFTTVGTVAADKNSKGYSYREPFPAGSLSSYYRLKIVDADGRFSYSPVIHLTTAPISSGIAVVPNPVKGNINVRIDHTLTENATLYLIDPIGKVIQKQPLTLQHSSQVILLPGTSQLAPGIYQVVLRTASGGLLKTNALLVK